MLCTVICNGHVLAGDLAARAGSPAPTDPLFPHFPPLAFPPLAALPLPVAGNFTAPPLIEKNVFSATDFRPRKHSLLDPEPAMDAAEEPPMLRGTTVWQRLADYKSRDRVRLLTLWESSLSTVSLQAGKRGDPSLQWTSRFMNRGGSTRGLLDELFSVSLSSAGNRLRRIGRSTPAQVPARQANAAPAAANTP